MAMIVATEEESKEYTQKAKEFFEMPHMKALYPYRSGANGAVAEYLASLDGKRLYRYGAKGEGPSKMNDVEL